ncbi:MAG: hypothetical protein OT477_13570 [Chloroflexi bacterium]|nr:hypothetical protein [Chloroflexota bacterium]
MGVEENYQKLFGQRSHYLPLHVGAKDVATGSRMGGLPPLCFETAPWCIHCGRPLDYYLTIASDIWQTIAHHTDSFSLFYCPDFDCRLYANSLFCLSHPESPRHVMAWPRANPMEGRAIVAGEITPEVEDIREAGSISKIGGLPILIQWGRIGRLEALEQEGLQFVFQFDEESYPRGFQIQSYVFGCGASYVYLSLDGSRSWLTAVGAKTVWQNS